MADDTTNSPKVTRRGKAWLLTSKCRHTGMWVATEYHTEGSAQRMCNTLRGVRYTHHGMNVTPLWSTRRSVAGGIAVDIEIRDPRSTVTYATVPAESIDEVPAGH